MLLTKNYECVCEIEKGRLKMIFFLFQVENVRRKHNYLPFIMELLKVLAEQGQLLPLVEKVIYILLLYHVLLSYMTSVFPSICLSICILLLCGNSVLFPGG